MGPPPNWRRPFCPWAHLGALQPAPVCGEVEADALEGALQRGSPDDQHHEHQVGEGGSEVHNLGDRETAGWRLRVRSTPDPAGARQDPLRARPGRGSPCRPFGQGMVAPSPDLRPTGSLTLPKLRMPFRLQRKMTAQARSRHSAKDPLTGPGSPRPALCTTPSTRWLEAEERDGGGERVARRDPPLRSPGPSPAGGPSEGERHGKSST